MCRTQRRWKSTAYSTGVRVGSSSIHQWLASATLHVKSWSRSLSTPHLRVCACTCVRIPLSRERQGRRLRFTKDVFFFSWIAKSIWTFCNRKAHLRLLYLELSLKCKINWILQYCLLVMLVKKEMQTIALKSSIQSRNIRLKTNSWNTLSTRTSDRWYNSPILQCYCAQRRGTWRKCELLTSIVQIHLFDREM